MTGCILNYNHTQGQFISQDPVFWEIGQTKDGQEVLTNPQAQNSYSYAGGNPISRSDKSGRLSREAWEDRPLTSIFKMSFWDNFAGGFNLFNKPFSSSLLRHSASYEPGDVKITIENQNYFGNPIDKIQNSKEYTKYLEKVIENADNGVLKTQSSLKFEDDGDLYYSLLRVKVESVVSKNKDGYSIETKISDVYDFNPINASTYKGTVTRIPAAQAYKDQEGGYLSNFNVELNFKHDLKK